MIETLKQLQTTEVLLLHFQILPAPSQNQHFLLYFLLLVPAPCSMGSMLCIFILCFLRFPVLHLFQSTCFCLLLSCSLLHHVLKFPNFFTQPYDNCQACPSEMSMLRVLDIQSCHPQNTLPSAGDH